MRTLVILSVVLGVVYGQGFPVESPEVQAARNAFIREYNRLAELAALAPDIHIYHRDPNDPLIPRPVNPPAFNAFSFSANLGDNQQFRPGPNTFPSHNLAGHLAGHMAGHQVAAPAPARPASRPVVSLPVHRFATEAPKPWTGPLADDTPAGVGGAVVETPSVSAAKAAHFQAHAAHWAHLARLDPMHV